VPVQIALVVREALSLLRSTIPVAVEIVADIDRRAPLVLANTTQIHQVIMNLGINAAHAMRAHGGKLSVRLHQRFVDHALAAELVDLKPGTHVCIEVRDTGCGMEPAVVARMFEPFFTTKKIGEGTGLGLAVVRSVVRSHEGAITVRTQPGAGTTFEIYFPVADVVEGVARAIPTEFPAGAGQRILLVDDETMITRSMQLLIERLGYVVTAFNQPERALERFAAAPDEFDLVITDFQMPGMTGVELAAKLLALRPGIGILVSSGFAGSLTDENVVELGLKGLLRKPVDMAELAEAIAGALVRKS
jgi:CheY-like chemotaxis protein